MVTWFGVWMRPHMTLALSRVLSWGSLATEAVLPVLLLAPVGQPRTRTFAIPLILGLHLGFQTFLNLGCFSWTMMSFTPYLISTQAWDWLARRATRVPRRVTVYFDAGCGVCFQIASVLARRRTKCRHPPNNPARLEFYPASSSPTYRRRTGPPASRA